MEALTGKQLGPYQVVEPLGEGGMAAVYKAYQPSMDRYVALKILPRHYADDPEFTGRFSHEARVIAQMQHPHILPVHDFGEADGYTYLVMPFVDGGTLRDLLDEGRPLPLTQIRRIISQVGDALDYAHGLGIVHRDVKPSNVLLDGRGNCLLGDFGLAKMVEGNVHFTKTGGIVGTPAYMSPEQGMGKSLDSRSDVYSLGIILYQMATGRAPYEAETPMAIMIKHINDPLPPPRQHNPELPEALERVILKALAKDPDDRFESVAAMKEALRAATEPSVVTAVPPVVAEEPVPEIPVPDDEEVPSAPTPIASSAIGEAETVVSSETATATAPSRRRPGWLLPAAGLLAVVAVIAVIAAGVLLLGNGEEGDEEPGVADAPAGEETDAAPGDDRPAPDSINALMERANNALDAGNLEEAVLILSRAIDRFPEEANLYCQRGYVMSDLNNLPRARDDFEQCAARARAQGDDSLRREAVGQAVYITAEIALEAEDSDRAVRILEEAISRPDAPYWLVCELGELHLSLGEPEEAIEAFVACGEQAEANGDDYWTTRSQGALGELRGKQALEEGDPAGAVAHFEQWAEAEPDSPWPYCSLGMAYLAQEAFDQAMDNYIACRDRPYDDYSVSVAESGLRRAQAQIALAEGNAEEALALYDEAISFHPDDPTLYCRKAEVLLMLDAPADAAVTAQECLDRAGDDPGLREWADMLLNEAESR